MHSLQKTIITYRSISWALVTALLFVLLLPAHYHLHHLDSADPATHAHAIVLHVITDELAHTHHDEGTSIFAATPDGIIKKDSPVFSSYPLLAFLLVILAVAHYRASTWSEHNDPGRKRHYPFFSPPLRAPPQH